MATRIPVGSCAPTPIFKGNLTSAVTNVVISEGQSSSHVSSNPGAPTTGDQTCLIWVQFRGRDECRHDTYPDQQFLADHLFDHREH